MQINSDSSVGLMILLYNNIFVATLLFKANIYVDSFVYLLTTLTV